MHTLTYHLLNHYFKHTVTPYITFYTSSNKIKGVNMNESNEYSMWNCTFFPI